MPSLSFKKKFAPKVESGEKTQTIRRRGKIKWRVGQTAHLFTGLRTPYCRRLGKGEVHEVTNVDIDEKRVVSRELRGGYMSPYPQKDLLELAKADGFDTIQEFTDFFSDHYGLPFKGVLIKWFLMVPAGVKIVEVISSK